MKHTPLPPLRKCLRCGLKTREPTRVCHRHSVREPLRLRLPMTEYQSCLTEMAARDNETGWPFED